MRRRTPPAVAMIITSRYKRTTTASAHGDLPTDLAKVGVPYPDQVPLRMLEAQPMKRIQVAAVQRGRYSQTRPPSGLLQIGLCPRGGVWIGKCCFAMIS